MLTFIDLCAGIGGFRLGMELAGHKCLGFCEYDKFAQKSYRAMHNTEGEWFADDVRTIRAVDIPRADMWCFGFPCQDISVAGKQLGFAGKRSGLFFAITGLIRELSEDDRPTYLIIENVKNFLSVNGGYDFLKAQIELDEIGYDTEWQLLNSKDFGVPQNRERIFVAGHFRGRSTRKIFPIIGEGGAASVEQLGNIVKTGNWGNPQRGRIYSVSGCSPTLNCCKGGGQEPKIAIPVLTPDRENKRQNGRRFKQDGEPMFTLTAQDKHGVVINVGKVNHKGISNCIDANYHKGLDNHQQRTGIPEGQRIRKLTPRECFRLQGWPDEYFERATAVNSDSQLYKQAGNGVTVNVVEAIGRRLG